MIKLGKVNTLKFSRQAGREYYLEAAGKKVLLADTKIAKNVQPGDALEVFVYADGEGHLLATTLMPKAQVDEVAWLRVAAVNYYGAFLDWGLPKELLLPFSEQLGEIQVGKFYLVRLFLDAQGRVAATAKIAPFLADKLDDTDELAVGQKVPLLIADATDLGFNAIINHRYWGLLYQNQLYQPVKKGQRIDGYIKQIRADGRIDLTLNPPGYAKVDPLAEAILARLNAAGGRLDLGDKSPPEAIYKTFGSSKKAFKQAIGALYKQHLIVIEDSQIRLVG